MRATTTEITLRRVLAWLRWSGLDITPQLQRQVLQAMTDALADNPPDLFGACLGRLAADTGLPPRATAPALSRGSIAYGDY
ncbi:MAG: hypothetical protein WC247_14275 [Porticoccaceae bacterium]